jgi:argininosuccinate lyase
MSLNALNVLLNNIQFNSVRMLAATRGDFSTATDLADFLVRSNLPFREAHEVVGNIVKHCERNKKTLEDVTSSELAQFSLLFKTANKDLGSVAGSVNSRNSQGGVGAGAMADQLQLARQTLGET